MMRERLLPLRIAEEDLMSDFSRPRSYLLGLVIFALVLAASPPAEAQRSYQPLFDKFNFKAELSWVGMNTSIGLYDDALDLGAVLNFEDDLNLGDREWTPSLDFEWQIGKRHRLAGRWQAVNRGSNAQALTEIEWGNEIIPIDADITLKTDLSQFFIDYTFYPWVKERWALGFGIGLRWMDMSASLAWTLESGGVEEGRQAAEVTAPLPYIYFEYRRLLTDHWRMILGAGWLDITIGDVGGSQYIGRAGFEYLLGKRWSVGGAFNVANVDAEARNIKDDEDLVDLRLTINMDVWDLSLFGRVRF